MRARKARQPQVREGRQYLFRMPVDMFEQLDELAWKNGRPMSSEVIAAIKEHLKCADRFQQIEARLEQLENQQRTMNHEPGTDDQQTERSRQHRQ